MIEYIAIFIIAIFIRLFPIRKLIIDFDTWGHTYLGYEVGRQKISPWGGVYMQCWESDKYRHPYLWHWFVGKFSKKIITTNAKWLNGILDAFFTTFLYWVFLNTFEEENAALIGALLYLFSPIWFSNISIGTRIASFTPRITSEILINIILILTFIDLGIEPAIKFFIVPLLISCVLLSSKFGVQALFFIVPLSSFLSQSYDLLFMFLIGILVPVIISRGEVFKMINRQLIHLTEYYQNNIYAPNAISERNKLSKLILWDKEGKFSFYGTIWSILATNSYTCVIFKLPIYLLAISLSFYALLNPDNNLIINQELLAPLIIATFLFLVINRPSLLFLGEAERYLSHIAFFIILISVDLAFQMNLVWLLWIIIFYGFLYWLIESVLIGSNSLSEKKERNAADLEVEKYLLEQKKPMLIASFPYHNFSLYRIMLNTIHKVIFPLHMKESIRTKFKKEFETRYAYLNLDKVDKLKEVTSLNLIILDKTALDNEGFNNWKPLKESWKKIKLNQSKYDIYKAY
jgi:hypothetical protein